MKGPLILPLTLAAVALAAGCRSAAPSVVERAGSTARWDTRRALTAMASGDPEQFTMAALVLSKDTPIARFDPLLWALYQGPDPIMLADGRLRILRLREMLASTDRETQTQGLMYLLANACDDWISLTPDLSPSDCTSLPDESIIALVETLREGNGQARTRAAEALFILRYSREPDILRLVLDTVREQSAPTFRELCMEEVREERLRDFVDDWRLALRSDAEDVAAGGTQAAEVRSQDYRNRWQVGLPTRGIWAVLVLGLENRASALEATLVTVLREESPVVREAIEPALALAAALIPGPPGSDLLVALTRSSVPACRWFAMHALFDRDSRTAEPVVLEGLLTGDSDTSWDAAAVLRMRGRSRESVAAIEAELLRVGEPVVVDGEDVGQVIPAERGARLRLVRRVILERMEEAPTK